MDVALDKYIESILILSRLFFTQDCTKCSENAHFYCATALCFIYFVTTFVTFDRYMYHNKLFFKLTTCIVIKKLHLFVSTKTKKISRFSGMLSEYFFCPCQRQNFFPQMVLFPVMLISHRGRPKKGFTSRDHSQNSR